MKRILSLALVLAALFGASRYAQQNNIPGLSRPSVPSLPTIATKAPEGQCPSIFLSGQMPTIPAITRQRTTLLCSTSYAALHSGMTKTPLWAAEALTRQSVAAARRVERVSEFDADDRLSPDERAELADYRRSGWDRGHLAPSGDMPGLHEQAQSFLLSNIIPQSADLNRGSWSELESDVRDLAARHGSAYVVTGVLFQNRQVHTTPNKRVIVPPAIWKAVTVPGKGGFVAIATNEDNPTWRRLTVKDFAGETGIDPFPALDAASRARLLEAN